MNIRPATLSDRSAIFAIAREQSARYPELKADVERMHGAITEAINSTKHFAWVVEVNGKITGTLLGFTSPNLWAQRQNSSIPLWVSKTPGTGAALLRRFRDWVTPRRGIRVAGMCPDLDLDPRILKLAERIGFKKHGGAYLMYN